MPYNISDFKEKIIPDTVMSSKSTPIFYEKQRFARGKTIRDAGCVIRAKTKDRGLSAEV